MKRLDIIIPRGHLRDLDKLLNKHKVEDMSFHTVKGRGRTQYEPVSVGRSTLRYVPEFGYWTRVEIVVLSDLLAENIINDILEIMGSSAGIIGKIFVSDLAEAHAIRSRKKEARRLRS
jgi:nitrogen regulatory protein P-II 1